MPEKVVNSDVYSNDGDNSDCSGVDDTGGVDTTGNVDANRDDVNSKTDWGNNMDDANDNNDDVGDVDDGGVYPNTGNVSVMARAKFDSIEDIAGVDSNNVVGGVKGCDSSKS